MKSYTLTITRPAGNDTGLIKGLVDKSLKKIINDIVQKDFTSVEQVGFYEYDNNDQTGVLEMAGGEFCGNATRSTAYVLLNGEPGQINMKVSGTSQTLVAGVRNVNSSFAQMPIYPEFTKIIRVDDTTSLVELEGIIHLITPRPVNANSDELKSIGRDLMATYNLLLPYKAAGVMFYSGSEQNIIIDPIIWVRDIKTLFYETACASGTTAFGLWKSLKGNDRKISLQILQPSGQQLTVSVTKNATAFMYAEIEGPLAILENNLEVCI